MVTRLETTGPTVRYSERDRRVALAASVGVAQRVLQMLSALVTLPLVLKALGPGQFGVWGATTSLAWLAAIVDLGIGSGLVTPVARAVALGRTEEARRYLGGVLAAGSGLAALLLAAGVAVVVGARSQTPYLIAAAGLALNVPLGTSGPIWLALQKGHVSGLWELVQTVLTLAGLVVAARFSHDLALFVAIVYGGLLAANAGSLIQLLVSHPELRPSLGSIPFQALRAAVSNGGMYFLLGVTSGLSFLLDNVLALSLLGPEASARMAVALRVCISASGVLWVISQPLWPAFAEAAARLDRRWIVRRLFSGSALMMAAALGGSALLIAIGRPLFRWWMRADLGIGRDLLWAMAAWLVSYAMTRVAAVLLNALSIIRFQVVVYAAATTVACILKFALAPAFHAAGILAATAITGTLIVAPAMFWRIRRWSREFAPAVS